jgi:hypothetical protein
MHSRAFGFEPDVKRGPAVPTAEEVVPIDTYRHGLIKEHNRLKPTCRR